MKLCTCSNVLWFSLISHVGRSFFFEITILSVFLIFKLNPILPLSSLIVDTKSCSSSSVPAINKISSAYLRLLIFTPPIPIPTYLRYFSD